MAQKLLITGANGFLGRNLFELTENKSSKLIFLTDIQDNFNGPISTGVSYKKCDLRNPVEVKFLFSDFKPDLVFHLAGTFSNSFDLDFSSNCLSTKNILDQTSGQTNRPRILLIGSAAEYGINSNLKGGIPENFPLSPVSVYGLSKTFQTQLMNFYFRVHGTDVVMGRIFNLLGRGLSTHLFMGNLYDQIDKLKSGLRNKINLGNLSAFRDYISAEKAVEKLWQIVESGKSGEVYNVGSGHPIQMKALLETILRQEGLSFEDVLEDSGRGPGVLSCYADVSKLESLRIENQKEGKELNSNVQNNRT